MKPHGENVIASSAILGETLEKVVSSLSDVSPGSPAHSSVLLLSP